MTSADTKNTGYILLSTEVELYVQALQTFSIEEISSRKYDIEFGNLLCFFEVIKLFIKI